MFMERRTENGKQALLPEVPWPGVRGQRRSELDRGRRCKDNIDRTGQPLGERLCGELQCQARDELLNRELFYSLKKAQIIIEGWRKYYTTTRPRSALGYRPPAPETMV